MLMLRSGLGHQKRINKEGLGGWHDANVFGFRFALSPHETITPLLEF